LISFDAIISFQSFAFISLSYSSSHYSSSDISRHADYSARPPFRLPIISSYFVCRHAPQRQRRNALRVDAPISAVTQMVKMRRVCGR
jgi:hypothetical protein